jgi:hypothetical protein
MKKPPCEKFRMCNVPNTNVKPAATKKVAMAQVRLLTSRVRRSARNMNYAV